METASPQIKNHTPSAIELTWLWAKIGMLSFGGPAAQIALMHREIVEQRRWLSEQQYLNALNFCMLLPGPEAMQLATYTGWRLYGTPGGLLAGLLFILPGALVVLFLAATYASLHSEPLLGAIFLGVKAAIVIIIINALINITERALHNKIHWLIAILAFMAIFFFNLAYPFIIVCAALLGFLMKSKTVAVTTAPNPSSRNQPLAKTLKTALIWLTIWLLPLILVGTLRDYPILGEISFFFSKLAVVSFGGAYSVLAYMTQDVVHQQHWLTASQMLDGLGLAETTPGPLILVTEFVGFLAAHGSQTPSSLSLGIAGAVITLWATFIPCFLWIFVGAPYIDWLATQPRLQGALAAITAAVVGVILNLSLWFTLHVFFIEVTANEIGWFTLWQPTLSSLNPLAIGLAIIFGLLSFRFKMNIFTLIGLGAILGALSQLI